MWSSSPSPASASRGRPERPCTDGVAQAYTGLVSLNIGADGIPHRTGQLMAVDMTTGLSACIAVQAALAEQARDRHAGAPPQRRVLDVSLMQSAAALMGFNVAEAGLLGRVPPLSNVPAGTYQGSDGRWFMVAFLREPEWVLFCQVMERPEIAEDPRFQGFPSRAEHRDILLPMLREIFAQCTAAEWSERFKAARMLCDLVNSPLDWLADPHVQAVGAAVPLAQPGLGTLPFPHARPRALERAGAGARRAYRGCVAGDRALNIEAAVAAQQPLVQRLLDGVAEIGRDPPGITRDAYGRGENQAQALIAGAGRALGLTASTDAGANLSLRWEGSDPSAKPILIGSHLDSVVQGGISMAPPASSPASARWRHCRPPASARAPPSKCWRCAARRRCGSASG
ncbi:CoA transferase [Siccirubricoccus deserti]